MHSHSSQTDPAEDNCLKQQLFLLGQTVNYKEFISKQLLHSCYSLLAAQFILVKYA